jgi:cytochrome d ubiquinol oxidase subunit I
MVSGGNVLFTLIGFFGMYTVLSLLYIFLMLRRIEHGADELNGTPAPLPATDHAY